MLCVHIIVMYHGEYLLFEDTDDTPYQKPIAVVGLAAHMCAKSGMGPVLREIATQFYSKEYVKAMLFLQFMATCIQHLS